MLHSRDPFSVTLPIGHHLRAEADAAPATGTKLLEPMTHWGADSALKIVRVDADKNEPARLHKPSVALIGFRLVNTGLPVILAFGNTAERVRPGRVADQVVAPVTT